MNWFTRLSSKERHTVTAAFLGWAMDGFDFMIFTFVMPTLIASNWISKSQSGLIVTWTLWCSAIGGWVAGILADRIGRVRMLQITVIWFSVFTFLCGFARNPTELLIYRALQGLGFGGEWAVGSVMIGEMIRAEYRGRAVGTVQSAWSVGWGLALIVATVLFQTLDKDVAWRWAFWIGLAPALLVIYVRRAVPEPELAQATRAQAQRQGANFLEIFSPQMLRSTVVASLMTTGMMGVYYASIIWLPTLLKNERKLTVLGSGAYMAVLIIGSWVGFMTAAQLADRIGRRNTFYLFTAGAGAIAVVYTLIPITDAMMLVLGFPLGFFILGIFSGLGPFLTELYPSRIRGSGQGFCYNFGRGFGSLAPFLVGYLSERQFGLSNAIGLIAGCSALLALTMIALLPETRGKVLAVYD